MRPRPSVILTTGVSVVFHTVLLFSLFLLFSGHNAPGGGFVGGLVGSAAFVLRYVEGGAEAARRTSRVPPATLLGVGLGLAVFTGVGAWLAGGEFLESGRVVLDLPLLGTVRAYSVLAFDAGVYLVVVGLVLTVLHSLGAQAER